MAKPFDAASKHLIEILPGDWLRLAGFPVPDSAADISIVDADLSNVITTSADKLIRVDNPPGGLVPYLAHVEFQSSADAELDRRIHLYNALSRRRHRMPVWSVVFLLRPQALIAGINGRLTDRLNHAVGLDFSYQLVRVWEIPTQTVLTGGLGTLPLAPITAVAPEGLPPVIEHVRNRLAAELPVQNGREFLLAMRVLMGLKYQNQLTERLMQSISEMEDSVEWQKIFRTGEARGIVKGKAEGRAEGERGLLLSQGSDRFGPASDLILQRLQSVGDAEELRKLGLRLLKVSSWEELFGG